MATMNISDIENKLKNLVEEVKDDEFIFDFLSAFGVPDASIKRLKDGDRNLSKVKNEIIWRNKIFFRFEKESDLHDTIDELKKSTLVSKFTPRFIIVTNFDSFLALDLVSGDSLDINFNKIHHNADFFLPLAGIEKAKLVAENPADIKAAENLGKLYDVIYQDNQPKSDDELHALNVFLSRLLFCFFAEDTDIFLKKQFSNSISSHTDTDGSDLTEYLERLFKVLNTENRKDLPSYLISFPYVNGGLFEKDYKVPKFSKKARQLIIDCGNLNWADINPDIFGSMIQAVVHKGKRSDFGIHYTSVTNIKKVIGPLFLDNLIQDLNDAGISKADLTRLHKKLQKIRVFDPACGSGNFLIISYKELCFIEIEILKKLYGNQTSFRFVSSIQLNQFFGIEIDDFAHETAKLSLWLAEHQMNTVFKQVFGTAKATLPLKEGGNIVCGDATKLKWEDVCPSDDNCEVYIIGNPPYLGSSMQSKSQKENLATVFNGFKNYKNLDFIACWFLLAGKYIKNRNAYAALVSTNSIVQGEQVSLLWPMLLQLGIEIGFCHLPFNWSNSAKGNAGVTCVVIGLRNKSNSKKYIFYDKHRKIAKNINPYLVDGENVIVGRGKRNISGFPPILRGDTPTDDGNLIFTKEEKDIFLNKYPNASKYFRKLVGSVELIRGYNRWCIWVQDEEVNEAKEIAGIAEIFEKVRKFRLNSNAPSTVENSKVCHRFLQIQHKEESSIIIPRVASERREYITCGFFPKGTIILDSAHVIYSPPKYIFSIISCKMHMAWVKVVAGRMRSDIRYSSELCYNAFPFPKIDSDKIKILDEFAVKIITEREKFPLLTIADLYDPNKMPQSLRKIHSDLDSFIDACYDPKGYANDNERLEVLFKMYKTNLKKS